MTRSRATERLEADRFLEDLTGKHARPYVDALDDLLLAEARGNRIARSAARTRLEEVIRETMGAAEVLGASLALRRAAEIFPEEGGLSFNDERRLLHFAEEPTQNILPRVTFAEAVQDMIDRTPVTLRRAAERTGQSISRIYSTGRVLRSPVIAFAQSADVAVTRRAQKLLVEALRDGVTEFQAGRQIVKSVNEVRIRAGDWTESYARTIFRTNLNSAVTSGRFRQVQDPDIKAVIPAFMFDAVGDVDTRKNHNAAEGTVMKVDNPEWRRIATPLGFN